MTSLEIIRSKQRLNKAVEDHAEAVRQRLQDEDSAKFAPLKKIYDEVKHLPAKPRYRFVYGSTTTLEGMWESVLESRRISFYNMMGDGGWNLMIEGGVFTQNNYDHHGSRTTEDAEEAKGWLVEKLATLLADEEAN